MRMTGIAKLQANLGIAADGALGPVTLQAIARYLAPAAPAGVGPALDAALRLGDARFTTGGPTTRRQLIHFMANIAHESGFRPISENLGYSATRLTEVWPHRFPTVASAQPFANNSQALANSIYASRMGNGPPASGDGYRFRGRGWPQLTGRDAYRQVGDLMGLPLETDPDQLLTLDGSAAASVGFWHWKACGIPADADETTSVRRRWNGGTIGLAEVRALADKLKAAWPA